MEPSCFRNLSERLEAFSSADLYPVITSEFCAGRSPFVVFQEAVANGAKVVQLREKSASKRELFSLAQACRPVANACRALLIINDHVDVALATNADGVHLGQEDIPIEAARRIAPNLLVGASTHNPEEIQAAQCAGAGYLNIGPLFATQTKTLSIEALGLDRLREFQPLVQIPYSVMGGIKMRHIPTLRELGARRIAMVTEITQAEDVGATVRRLREEILKSDTK
ncbi:MAG: thiamine phosphate synthase [Planctomycetia bacterium]|nr:thiamine phosphate synthase [Planctomycetia bacterium]